MIALAALWPQPGFPARAAPAGGAGVSTSVPAPATANYVSRPFAFNSPQLAADPTDGRFVAMAHRVDAPRFGCALEVSGDGGRNWVGARAVPRLPPGAETCYAPEVAFDRGGALYYLFSGLKGRGNEPMGIFLTVSRDRGRTFSVPRKVLGPHNYAARIAVDATRGPRGRLHLVWLHASSDPPLGAMPAGDNPILAAHSDDGGKRFSKPVRVSDRRRRLPAAPAVAVGPAGKVHAVYWDLKDDVRDYRGLEGPPWEGTWSLVHARSDDGGGSFVGREVNGDVRPPGRVMLIFTMPPAALAAGPRGALYAAWADARAGDWDVLLARSPDGGKTWPDPVRLSGGSGHQYLPAISAGSSGRLDAVFYDRRDDPANLSNRTYYTYSTAPSARFGPPVEVSRGASDTTVGVKYSGAAARGLIEFGSRLAVLSGPRSAVAAWTDTHNSAATPQQDVYSSVIGGLPEAAR